MRRLEKPGWSACKELEETKKKYGRIQRSPHIKSLTTASKKNIDQVKINLKQQLPVLTAVGIRRYRLPHYKSMLLELRECGMLETSKYIEELLQMDENTNDKKSLKFQRGYIDQLKNSLVNAEIAKRENKHRDETTILFDATRFFQSLSNQWLWLVDELLKKTLTAAAKIHDDDGLTNNIIKFTYGKFLSHYMKDLEGALCYLNDARDASKGKNWNATKFLKEKQDNLYRECNILLYEIHHTMARKFRSVNPKIAVKTSFEALKCANDSEDNSYIAKALYALGESQMEVGDVTNALKIFAKFLAKVKRIPDHKSICNAHKQLALAHQNLKNDTGTREHFRLFKECAESYHLPDQLADAFYLTGKYFLERGLSSDASPHLKMAFDMYKNFMMIKEMDETRYLLGVSKGEEVIEEFMKLILNCGIKDKNSTLKLLQWKNRRIPFWSPNYSDVETSNENKENLYGQISSVFLTESGSTLEKSNHKNSEDSMKIID